MVYFFLIQNIHYTLRNSRKQNNRRFSLNFMQRFWLCSFNRGVCVVAQCLQFVGWLDVCTILTCVEWNEIQDGLDDALCIPYMHKNDDIGCFTDTSSWHNNIAMFKWFIFSAKIKGTLSNWTQKGVEFSTRVRVGSVCGSVADAYFGFDWALRSLGGMEKRLCMVCYDNDSYVRAWTEDRVLSTGSCTVGLLGYHI
jgi:hypothetical protein